MSQTVAWLGELDAQAALGGASEPTEGGGPDVIECSRSGAEPVVNKASRRGQPVRSQTLAVSTSIPAGDGPPGPAGRWCETRALVRRGELVYSRRERPERSLRGGTLAWCREKSCRRPFVDDMNFLTARDAIS